MKKIKSKKLVRGERRARKTRMKVRGVEKRPRLTVFRSNRKIYAQAIDDEKGVTVAAASGVDPKKVGEQVSKDLKKKKVKGVVFDRGKYKYHGRVKVLAEAVREGGVKI